MLAVPVGKPPATGRDRQCRNKREAHASNPRWSDLGPAGWTSIIKDRRTRLDRPCCCWHRDRRLSFIAYVFIPALFVLLTNWLWTNVGPFWSKLLATGAMATIALGLFWLRSKALMIYGALEVLFGLFSCWTYLGGDKAPDWHNVQPLVLVGAVYLLVRGFSNMKDAGDKPERDAESQDLVRRVRHLYSFFPARASQAESPSRDPA
jgi:hypothetical protein